MQSVQFPTKDDSNFYQTLRSRVDGYFKENNIGSEPEPEPCETCAK